MKKIRRIYTRSMLALAVIGAASCSIDEYNPSNANADEVWATPEGFVTAVNGAYSELRSWYGKEDGIFMSETGTDLWFNEPKNLTYARQLTKYEGLSAADGNPNKSGWKLLYSAINVCNAGIDRIGNAGFTDDNERKKREGELRFLRGFYYWHVVETWGGVNLRIHETKDAELTAVRSSVDAFYDQIISDLELAADYLPNDWGAEYSRATKKAALGVLARAYLSRAYYGGANANTYFTKARDIAQSVIDRKGEFKVDLSAKYADLWNSTTNNKKIGQANGEGLFVVSNSTNSALNYDGGVKGGNLLYPVFQTTYYAFPGLINSIDYGYDNSKRLMPTRALLKMYDETMDSRYTGSFQEVWIANKADDPATSADDRYKWNATDVTKYGKDVSVTGDIMEVGKDTALLITKQEVVANEATKPYVIYDLNDIYGADGKIKVTGQSAPYVNLKKYIDLSRTTVSSTVGFNDVVVMRFAEMYMIAAEAEFNLGNLSSAATYINVLRTRAAIKAPVDQTANMQVDAGDITLDFILDEYAREFAGEYRRWFDLKRTRTLLDRVHTYNPDITQIQPFHVLRPVPNTEMTLLLNADEFGQNEGYQ